MKITDLDDMIEDSRGVVRRLERLDLPNLPNTVSIDSILAEIRGEAGKITDPSIDGKPDKILVVPAQPLVNKSYIIFLKNIEKRLRKIGLYENHIRPVLKNKFNRDYSEKRVINAQLLLQYNDGQFVDALYRNILGREADSEGKKNNLFLLRNGAFSKIDMLYAFLNSEEGKNRGLILTGVGLARLKNNIKRFMLKVPIVSYCLRWMVDVILLPRKILELQHKLAELSMELELSSVVKDQEEKLTKLENRLSVYDEEKSQQIQRYKHQEQCLNEIYLEYEKDLMFKPRKETKDELRVYIDKLEEWVDGRNKESLSVLDLGCGAGEWLELLVEQGYAAKGVDSNELVVSDARKQNPLLEIVVEDAVSYLKSLPEDSLDMISSFQMIEHLDLIELYELFDELKRVLKPEGMLLLVTPNAQNILTATYMFRVDPTHKNPIPVEVLQFYLKRWGFDVTETVFTNPLNYVAYDFNTDDTFKHIAYRFNLEQDYGVLAVKK